MELQSSDEPAWNYLDYQYSQILEDMRIMYDRANAVVVDAQKAAAAEPSSSSPLTDLLRRQLAQMEYVPNSMSRELTVVGGLTAVTATEIAWTAIQTLVRQLSEYVVRSMPGFWKIAKACMDGKFRTRDASGTLRASHRPATECRSMASNIVKLYIATLSQFFKLNDISVANAPNLRRDGLRDVPSFVPAGSTVLAASYFCERIVDDVADCVTELMAIDVGKDASQAARAMLDSLRWRMEEVVTATWHRDARSLHLLEKAPTGTDRHRGHGPYLKIAEDFQKRVLLSARTIAAGPSGRSKELPPVPSMFKRKIREAAIEAENLVYEGLLSTSTAGDKTTKESESRLLDGLAAFETIRTQHVPQLVKNLVEQIGDEAESDRSTLDDMVQRMDSALFTEYTDRWANRLSTLIRSGIDGIDWLNTPTPTEVRPYMHEVVLSLVEAHAQVSDASLSLVSRVVKHLVEKVYETAASCFRNVSFGTGGMLTATLEVEFLTQSVGSAFLSSRGKTALEKVYSYISRGYRRQDGEVQRDMEAMRKLLLESRRSTAIETLCFVPA